MTTKKNEQKVMQQQSGTTVQGTASPQTDSPSPWKQKGDTTISE